MATPTKHNPKSPKKPTENDQSSSKQLQDIPTYKLLTSPAVFNHGLEYFKKLVTNQMTIEEVYKKMGMGPDSDEEEPNDDSSMPPSKSKRELSPDPDTCLTSEVKIRKIEKSTKQAATGTSHSEPRQKDRVGSSENEKSTDDESTPKVKVSDIEGHTVEELYRELMRRKKANTPEEDAHNPEAIPNFVPEYGRKLAKFNQNSLKIKNLTWEELKESFNCVRDELKGIYAGTISSTRHTLYKQGFLLARKSLEELCVSIPFTIKQGSDLFALIYEFLPPTVEKNLTELTRYVSYVMHPEALIRIYAKVTDQTYDMAQLEMRFGGCYE